MNHLDYEAASIGLFRKPGESDARLAMRIDFHEQLRSTSHSGWDDIPIQMGKCASLPRHLKAVQKGDRVETHSPMIVGCDKLRGTVIESYVFTDQDPLHLVLLDSNQSQVLFPEKILLHSY